MRVHRLPSLALVALAALACAQTHPVTPAAAVDAPTEIVASTQVPDERVTTGTVRSTTVSPLSSKVIGNVTRVLVSEGDVVRAGQLLVEIDDRDLQARGEQARAAATAGGEAIASATAAVSAAEATAHLAEATYRRYAALRERGSVSPQEFDDVAAKTKAAQAELERARRGRDQAIAQGAQSRAGVAEANAFAGYARVRSPIDGVVAARFVDEGAQAAPGVPLVTIEDPAHRRVETTVDEQLAAAIHIGDSVRVEDEQARVTNIAPLDPMTRTALVKIALAPASRLRSGSFVRVRFTTGSRTAITAPATALITRGQLTSVFVVDGEGIAHMRLVTAGDRLAGRIELLSGLDAGERIVTAAGGVRDGVRVGAAS